MTKWLRYETAKDDPLYKTIVRSAENILEALGAFSKEEALKQAGFAILDDSVFRWDYIKRMIEDKNDTELIPLASQFFSAKRDKRHSTSYPPDQFPERYLAHGYGKKTAGFCTAEQRNGHFFLTQLKIKHEQVKGRAKAHDRLLRVGRTESIPATRGKVLLEPNVR